MTDLTKEKVYELLDGENDFSIFASQDSWLLTPAAFRALREKITAYKLESDPSMMLINRDVIRLSRTMREPYYIQYPNDKRITVSYGRRNGKLARIYSGVDDNEKQSAVVWVFNFNMAATAKVMGDFRPLLDQLDY